MNQAGLIDTANLVCGMLAVRVCVHYFSGELSGLFLTATLGPNLHVLLFVQLGKTQVGNVWTDKGIVYRQQWG